jgi:cytochrome b561
MTSNGTRDYRRRMSTQTYGPVTIFLHWAVAACILFSVVLGLILGNVEESDATSVILGIHKSIGITIFLLACVRLVWRVRHPAPPLPASVSAAQRMAAKITHALLYVTLFAMPLTGYVAVAARGRETTFLGLIDVPRLTPLDRVLSRTAETIHGYWQYALYALLAAHIGAAIYHHFVLKDGVLARMLPRQRSTGTMRSVSPEM